MDASPAQPAAPGIRKVMISSTTLDLPEHRQQVRDACLREGMFPLMMEHLPASDADAIATSLRLVNEADLYLGIFAFRYGYIPRGSSVSLTEMEYQRAVERGIPRLIFLMDDSHPLTMADVERGEGASKLDALRTRLQTERVVNYFTSSAQLQAQVIHSLSQYRQPNLTAFHFISDIPTPPEPYIAHPYTLLQTSTLVGRQAELNLLTDWVAQPRSSLFPARILCLVAMGGMGKSALSWQWFHTIAPQEMQPLAGRLWWSFYESDASFDNFVIRALSYMNHRLREEIERLPAPQREEQLLNLLDREPFLLVLDGMERLLIAYARMDAARLLDDELDQRTANVVAGALGLPESAAASFTGQYRLRLAADLRTGTFLRKLATVRTSRILVSTRLYPADLQTAVGSARAGSKALFLEGLSDDDALSLWRTFEITGSRQALLPLFHTFENHPLLLQVLAGEIANDRHTPGDFESWRSAHPAFDPFGLPLVQVRSHILAAALSGLSQAARQVISTIAAFRMPAAYDTLVALFVGEDKPCADEPALIALLSELEDRGLLGWDRRANRYDLHPIVRGVTWAGLGQQTRHGIYETLHTHFASLPTIGDWQQVERLEDLTTNIELYQTLVGLERYEDANELYQERLGNALVYTLGASRQLIELLALLFPDGLERSPRLSQPHAQGYVLNDLALGILYTGQPGQAATLFRRCLDIDEGADGKSEMLVHLSNLAEALPLSGALHEAEYVLRQAIIIARQEDNQDNEARVLYILGRALAMRGQFVDSTQAFAQARALRTPGYPPALLAYQAMATLWAGASYDAHALAEQARTSSQQWRIERIAILAERLQGEISLTLGDLAKADEHLGHALVRARTVNFVQEELPALVALAELRRQQDQLDAARELLDEVWEPVQRGPYPLIHADACNVLTQIESEAGHHEAAVTAATSAYRLAWCDGPPFAYHWGLQQARANLAVLGAPEPTLPPFDASRYEPMPEVEIEPPEEQETNE